MSVTRSVTVEEIRLAHARIADVARRTPVVPSVSLGELTGVPVHLKCENLQRVGSFKVRGAANMLATAEIGAAGVVAASAGNHAQGVALAAQARGVPATIVMPASAPLAKREATRSYGAQVELVDGPLADARRRAVALAVERDALYVPPFDAPEIVAGQGTVGLEIAEQCPQVETVLVPTGGGGLLAGVAVALRAELPGVRVVGVQTVAMPGVLRSREAGEATAVPPRRTIADGVAVAGPSDLTWELIREHVSDIVTVEEEAIARAIILLLERSRLVAEGAGALGVAALLSGAVRPSGETVVVVSGGNIDLTLLDRLVDRGLAADGRRRVVTFAVAHAPGELAHITQLVSQARANVVEVQHDLAPVDLPVGLARITLRIEVAGPDGFAELERALLDGGILPGGVGGGAETDFHTPAAAAWPH